MQPNPRDRGSANSATAMKRQPEHKSDLVALGIEQRAHGQRRHHQPEGLREGDRAILRGREMKAVRQIGQNGAQHGGNHSVDEDGENGGKDQHAEDSFRYRRQE